jgi:hypothetical protein
LSKNIFDTDFEIIDGLPKKGKPKLLNVKITYGKVGSGTLTNLITDKHIYRVKTGDYIGGQVWECEVLETVNREPT